MLLKLIQLNNAVNFRQKETSLLCWALLWGFGRSTLAGTGAMSISDAEVAGLGCKCPLSGTVHTCSADLA